MGLTGKQLNDEWKVGARHALFSRDGRWYENLERFPGALFDALGFVLFKTEKDYRNSPRVRIGQKTNVSGGISRLPGYVRKPQE
jgi:5-methylcytosine-specific restriction protein A